MPKRSRFWLARQLLSRPLVPAYATGDQFQGVEAVTAVPFNCYLRGNEPDATNLAIADFAARYMRRYKLPFLGQWEHTSLLTRWPDLVAFGVCQFDSRNGERVESQRLIKWQAVKVLSWRRGAKVITIGMPEHLGRVVILQEYFGLEPLVAPESVQVPYDSRARPGAQEWCKTRKAFTRYERTTARLGTAGKAFLVPQQF